MQIRSRRWPITLAFFLVCACPCIAQEVPPDTPIPPRFRLDFETAARQRAQFQVQSSPIGAPYVVSLIVFRQVIDHVPAEIAARFHWELRLINEGDELNAYSSPDGTIYIGRGLAAVAGGNAGLWAAILSHEIAHVTRRDWARRYLYQESLERDSASEILLGDPALSGTSWRDSRKASEMLGQFCRQLELEADRTSLELMVRAGYHPHFVPSLHHLLHARGSSSTASSLYAMHPCWEERDRDLAKAYLDASIEFEHLWPEWYASPGGNPPILVFTDKPVLKRTASSEWELQVEIHCENLAGAVEVVVQFDPSAPSASKHTSPGNPSDFEQRQVTGCTSSPRSLLTFTLPRSYSPTASQSKWPNVYVLDSWGALLARADVPKLRR